MLQDLIWLAFLRDNLLGQRGRLALHNILVSDDCDTTTMATAEVNSYRTSSISRYSGFV